MSGTEAPLILGAKSVAILEMAALPALDLEHRQRVYRALCDKFSEKSVRLKIDELAERGYLEHAGTTAALLKSWLTDKGRHALEHHVMRD